MSTLIQIQLDPVLVSCQLIIPLLLFQKLAKKTAETLEPQFTVVHRICLCCGPVNRTTNTSLLFLIVHYSLSHMLCVSAGVIAAGGEVKLLVTFTPSQYQTSQLTFQLIVSQFNTKPFLCTVTGRSGPHTGLRLVLLFCKHMSHIICHMSGGIGFLANMQANVLQVLFM